MNARRPNVLGIHSIDHFSINVPDVGVANDFYRSFGLDVRTAPGGIELYAAGGPHRWATFQEAKHKHLNYLCFGAFADDLPAFRERLNQRGIELLAAPAGVAGRDDDLWFRDLHGTLLAIRAAEKVSPDAKSPVDNPSPRAGVRGMPLRDAVLPVHPRRLSHVLLFSPDVPQSIAFYRDVLGLRLSDAAADVIGFMHGVHGSDHHLVAFAKSDAPGYHHSSWDVGSFHDVGLGAMQMADAGHRAGWGVGRHVLGSNYFHYVRDPWNSYSEYSHDIDYVPVDCEWTESYTSPDNGFYLWGPQPPPEFVVNYESSAVAVVS